jgi:hypothetical protein
MLQPMFAVRLAVALGALWCAWMVFVHAFQINARVPATIDPPQPVAVMIRTVQITPEPSFEERWQAPAPAMQQARIATEAHLSPEQPKVIQNSSRHVARHADRVCGSRGRRYFHIGRRLSWRCRR